MPTAMTRIKYMMRQAEYKQMITELTDRKMQEANVTDAKVRIGYQSASASEVFNSLPAEKQAEIEKEVKDIKVNGNSEEERRR